MVCSTTVCRHSLPPISHRYHRQTMKSCGGCSMMRNFCFSTLTGKSFHEPRRRSFVELRNHLDPRSRRNRTFPPAPAAIVSSLMASLRSASWKRLDPEAGCVPQTRPMGRSLTEPCDEVQRCGIRLLCASTATHKPRASSSNRPALSVSDSEPLV
jgi:hypothetical protein